MSLQLAAQHLASQGRNGDSTLVHMTPSEVKGLQDLALMHGGSLTINPATGLPEASFLSSILPTIAGFALNTFMPGFGTAIGEIFNLGSAAGTAIGVGAVTGLAKGSISEGLMAGMGAYGGANLSEGMMGAGAQELGKNATSQFADVATKGPNVAGNPAVPTTASAWDKISAGATSGHVGDYMKTMGGPSLMQAGLMAASPILADAMVPTTTKAPPVQNTAFIRQKIYDPGTGTYRSLTPVAASDWGNRSFSDIYAANGGIMSSDKVKHYAGVGDSLVKPTFTNDQVASYIRDNNLDAIGAQKAATAFGVSPEQLTAAQGLLGPTGNLTGVNAAHNAYQAAVAGKPELVAQNAAFSTANNLTTSPTGGNSNAFLAASNTGGIGLSALDTNLRTYADNVNPAFINTLPGATGGGLDSLAEIQARIRADMAANGVSEADMQRATGTTVAQLAAKGAPTEYGVFDAANACPAGYHWDAGAKSCVLDFPEKVDTFNTVTDAVSVPSIIKTQADTFNSDPTLMGQAAAQSGIAGGVGGSAGAGRVGGGTSINQDTGMIVESPVIPGIPVGGFTGAENMRDIYETGGGSLGYTSPTPTSYQALEDEYSRSANQQAILDYMQGKPGAKYPTRPIIEGGGEISRSYREVQGYPASSNKQWNYDPKTQQYSKNRDYVPMNRDKGGDPVYGMSLNAVKQAYTDQAVTDADLFTWMNTQDLTPQDLSDALGIPLSAVMAKFGTKKVAANGGMMYAGGGVVTKDADGVEHKVMDNGTAWIRRNPFMAWERDYNYSMSDPYASSSTKGQEASGGSPSPSLGRDNGTYSGLTGPDSVFGQDINNATVANAGTSIGMPGATVGLGSGIQGGDKAAGANAGFSGSLGSGIEGSDKAGGPPGMGAGADAADASAAPDGPGEANGGAIGRYPSHGEGTLGSYSDGGRLLRGPGDGVSDSIPATIGGRRPARLADGEFVVPARIVSELGNGSTEAGARKLYAMLDRIQAHRGKSVGKGKVAVNSRADKFLPA